MRRMGGEEEWREELREGGREEWRGHGKTARKS
jgi:hypothetical protein